jgi:hypothetical protein
MNEIYNPGKLMGLLKNKYGTIILYKTLTYLSEKDRLDRKALLSSKVNVTASKEKKRLNEFLESLGSEI